MTTHHRSAHSELRDLIGTVWSQMDGRGTVGDVVAHMGVALPEDLRTYLLDRGLAAAVSAFFRVQAANGLPQAPAIDEHGTHAQLEFLDVGEFRYVIGKYMASSAATRAQAGKAQRLCMETHGVLIDLDDPWAAAS